MFAGSDWLKPHERNIHSTELADGIETGVGHIQFMRIPPHDQENQNVQGD